MGKLRTDLNDMVKNISLKKVKTKFNENSVCVVTLFNDETVEFSDKNNSLYDLLLSYKKCEKENIIKSKKLVEMEKMSDLDSLEEGTVSSKKGTYVAVVYELTNGYKSYLFPSRFVNYEIIDNYYELFKSRQQGKSRKIGE